MQEQFFTIPFSTNYEISKLGNVRNRFTKQVLKPQIGTTGYYGVNIKNSNGKFRMMKIHRIMALTFLDNPEEKRTVNHKDGNKLNNKLSNLEWATDLENSTHARETGLCEQGIKLKATNIVTNETFIFASRSECAKYLNTTKFYISRCINKRNGIYKEWKLESLEEYKYPRVPNP
jgi:hypothetical protein